MENCLNVLIVRPNRYNILQPKSYTP